jgi:hypothetical protein
MDINKYELTNPEKTLALANELGRFIKEKKLTTQIQGKEFVNVEGWQFALSQLGIMPVLKSCEDLSKEPEIKYRAEVDLIRIADDKVVGKGIALCSNKERTKRSFEEYAIASMAQTRAEGKAARMLLSWLMKAAGYETTPAEEMVDTEYADEIGNSSRDFLHNLVQTSTFDQQKKDNYDLRIDSLITWEEYEKAKTFLMANQMEDRDRIQDGRPFNQSDITKTMRRKMNSEA